MISVVTAYFNRRKLLLRTLESVKLNYGKIDFEFIVVDDGSDEDERLEDLQNTYPFLRVIRLEKTDKWYSNPCIPFNRGFEEAYGEKIVIQNPECYHFDNILKYVDQHLKKNDYLSFGCFSLDKKNTDDDTLFFNRNNIELLIENNTHIVQTDGGLGWYNHSIFRPTAYHFCTAIMTSDLVDLGGFDTRYALGHGFDDDELIFRIKQKGMKIQFINSEKVIHQNHYLKQTSVDEQKEKYKNDKTERNKSIFQNITKNSSNYRANFIIIGTRSQRVQFFLIQVLKNYFRRFSYRLSRNFNNFFQNY
jgi:GT2 family glycosyltransferase